ncbi:MAG TPA: sugar O-acetyltransferase [Bryobacteraceae bacterium]
MDSEKQKMLAGELYFAEDPELIADRNRAAKLLRAYNSSSERSEQATNLLRELLGQIEAGSVIRAPFFCDYGYNIAIGRGVFLNFNCILLDVMPIRIGDGCQIGPGVQIYAADHPRDPGTRRRGLENGKPVTVGRNVWIGGGAILLPGITIGDDATVGAGSVVTRTVAAGTTVAGNPARQVERRR